MSQATPTPTDHEAPHGIVEHTPLPVESGSGDTEDMSKDIAAHNLCCDYGFESGFYSYFYCDVSLGLCLFLGLVILGRGGDQSYSYPKNKNQHLRCGP